MKNKPYTLDFEKRPLSWSAISSFDWSDYEWFDKYILGNKQPETPEMVFGKTVGERLASDPAYLPQVVRYEVFEHELKPRFDGIPLIGYMDTFRPSTHMREYKTGQKPWTQKRVDEHGQIDMYLLSLYLLDKVKPQDVEVHLDWLPTYKANGEVRFLDETAVHTFPTKRSMADIIKFGNRILDTVARMRQYVEDRNNRYERN